MAVANQKRAHALFAMVKSEGSILPMDLLLRVSDHQNAQLAGLTPDDYNLPAIPLHEAISRDWSVLMGLWRRFRNERRGWTEYQRTEKTRKRWLLPLFGVLGYTSLKGQPAIVVGERHYPISHTQERIPVHLVSYTTSLDRSGTGNRGERQSSPHSLVQALLNHSPEYLWGIVTNGLILRLLRNNKSLAGQAYVEFNLEEMFEHEAYADFTLFWLLCHQSRIKGDRPADCWLEKWSQEAHATGTRSLEDLRHHVAMAIRELGSGFIAHPANGQLRQKLGDGRLSALDYYNQLLRMIYRWLILFVAEDRDILFHPNALPAARQLYRDHYSTARLRAMADRTLGTRHSDLYYGLQLVMTRLGQDDGCSELGLPALNGKLFASDNVSDLNACQLANYALLATMRHLGYIESGHVRRIIDYKNLASEELGSVYESLLEQHPIFHTETGAFELGTATGNTRKTTGSYYTSHSLVSCLLDTALDPVLDEAANRSTAAEAEAAILNLKVCDPACGSGHFLVAAAHRIAKRLAAIRTGDEEPSPEAHRHALREVVSRCIYGVDLDSMAIDLCKVSLWMESIEPGKPLSFLDAHIQCGNSLLGATSALLEKGIPDEAFEPIEGDEKKVCTEFKKLNRKQREGQLTLMREEQEQTGQQGKLLRERILRVNEMPDRSIAEVRHKNEAYQEACASGEYQNALLWANTWCAAFVWKKTTEMRPAITEEEFRDIGRNPCSLAPWRRTEIERLARQYQFFHWHLAFPEVFRVPGEGEAAEHEPTGWSGGFDVVLGNPPWERIKIQEKEWFATRNEEIATAANAAARKRLIEHLPTTDPALSTAFHDALRAAEGESALVRRSGRYPLCGRGDVNTYSIFAEQMRGIIGPHGRVGCIVPSGIATDDTTKYFFQDLMESQSLISFYSFINEAKIFPGVDHRVIFALLTMSGRAASFDKADLVFGIYRTNELHEHGKHFSLSARDLRLLNPNTRTCSIFRSKRDMLITRAIYERVPVLIKEGAVEENPWGITFSRMFDMSNDSHLFRTREQLEAEDWRLEGNVFRREGEACLPLYEGKMISHYDHRFGTYNATTEEFGSTMEKEHTDPDMLALPRYWVHEAEMPMVAQDGRKALLAFRDITQSTNARTAIFGLVPVTAIGHTLPVALIEKNHHWDQLFLTGSFSSFVLDFVARQKLGGTHMTFFILKQLPILPPTIYPTACSWFPTQTLGEWIAPRALELTYTAWDLAPFARDCGYHGSPFRWNEERRFLLGCELDAAYFHLYGITRDNVDYIMDSFWTKRERDEKLYGNYRTKRVILDVYNEMQQAMENGKAYQTRLVPGPADPVVAHKGQ
jgi:hypothetical protein